MLTFTTVAATISGSPLQSRDMQAEKQRSGAECSIDNRAFPTPCILASRITHRVIAYHAAHIVVIHAATGGWCPAVPASPCEGQQCCHAQCCHVVSKLQPSDCTPKRDLSRRHLSVACAVPVRVERGVDTTTTDTANRVSTLFSAVFVAVTLPGGHGRSLARRVYSSV